MEELSEKRIDCCSGHSMPSSHVQTTLGVTEEDISTEERLIALLLPYLDKTSTVNLHYIDLHLTQ